MEEELILFLKWISDGHECFDRCGHWIVPEYIKPESVVKEYLKQKEDVCTNKK